MRFSSSLSPSKLVGWLFHLAREPARALPYAACVLCGLRITVYVLPVLLIGMRANLGTYAVERRHPGLQFQKGGGGRFTAAWGNT